ncbi:MAG: hypothetical protein ACYSUI_19695 [Planctomycetota bacterium]
MKRRQWKRLLVGWVLVSLVLSAPAAAQYTYWTTHDYGYSPGDSGDDGPGIKPWMLLAGLVSSAASGGSLGGCTTNR